MEAITENDMESAANEGLIVMDLHMQAYRAIVNVMAEKSRAVKNRIVADWGARLDIQQEERDNWER